MGLQTSPQRCTLRLGGCEFEPQLGHSKGDIPHTHTHPLLGTRIWDHGGEGSKGRG